MTSGMCPPRMDPATVEAVTEHLRATLLAEIRENARDQRINGMTGIAMRAALSEAADMIEAALASLERDAHEASR